MGRTINPASSKLRAILDVAGTMIITTDLAGAVWIFNPATERLLGWNADEVVGRHAPVLWHDPAEVVARAAELSHELGRTVWSGFEVFVAKARDQLNEQRQWTFICTDSSRSLAQHVGWSKIRRALQRPILQHFGRCAIYRQRGWLSLNASIRRFVAYWTTDDVLAAFIIFTF